MINGILNKILEGFGEDVYKQLKLLTNKILREGIDVKATCQEIKKFLEEYKVSLLWELVYICPDITTSLPEDESAICPKVQGKFD